MSIGILARSSGYREMRIKRKKYKVFYASILGLIAITLLAIYPTPFRNGSTTAAPGTATVSETNISLTSATTETSLSLTPGSFAVSAAGDTAGYNATTNNFSGYTISLLAEDDNRTLVKTDDATKTVPSFTNSIEQSTIVPTNPALVNRWGIKPNKYYDATTSTTIINTTKILPAPDTSGTILDVTNVANSAANNYSIAVGAMIDELKPVGTYTIDATLVAVPNPIYYIFTFDKNTTDTVTNMPSTLDSSTTEIIVSLPNNTPSRAHYSFEGWCLGTTTTTDGVDTCTDGSGGTGTVFQPGAGFGIDQTTENIVTLHAMWRIDTHDITIQFSAGISKVTLNGIECATASGCVVNDLVYGQTYNLVATVATGYSFTSWDPGANGTIADTTSTGISTTYTVGDGDSTITPTATINQYTCTKQYRLQNNDGTFPSTYTTDTTEQVDYNATCSYEKTVTNYKGSDSGANNTPGTASGTMTTEGLTLKVDMYRNTFTVALTNGTGISAVSVTGTGIKTGSGTASATVYYGGDITIGATLSNNYN